MYRLDRTAFSQFGMSVFDMSLDKFLMPAQYDVFTFGRPPACIDFLTPLMLRISKISLRTVSNFLFFLLFTTNSTDMNEFFESGRRKHT